MRPGLERYLIFYCALKMHWKHGKVLLKIGILPWIFCPWNMKSTGFFHCQYMICTDPVHAKKLMDICLRLDVATHHGQDNMVEILQTTFQPHFFEWKYCFFYGYFIVNLFQGILLIIRHYFFWFHMGKYSYSYISTPTHTHVKIKYSYSYSCT